VLEPAANGVEHEPAPVLLDLVDRSHQVSGQSHGHALGRWHFLLRGMLFGLMPEGTEAPAMSAEGRIVAGQTFDLSHETLFTDGRARFTFEAARIVDGLVDAASDDTVPFQILSPEGERIELVLERVRLSEDGLERGVLGGRLDVEDTIVALTSFADPRLVDILIRGLADLDPDDSGHCQSVSAAAIFEGVPAVEGVVR